MHQLHSSPFVSVPEMTPSGEDHRHPVRVRGRDELGIAHRASGLNHRPDADLRRLLQTVAERQEGIGGHHRALKIETGLACLHDGNAHAPHPARLSTADAQRLPIAGDDDGIGAHRLHAAPGEAKIFPFRGFGFALRDHPRRLPGGSAGVGLLPEPESSQRAPLSSPHGIGRNREGPQFRFSRQDRERLLRESGGEQRLRELALRGCVRSSARRAGG